MLVVAGAAVCAAAIVAAPVALGSTVPRSADALREFFTPTTPTPRASPSAPAEPSDTAPTATSVPTLAGLPARARALIMGDSFTEGYGASPGAPTWAEIAAETLRWRATIDGIGGTGFAKTTATDGSTGLGFRSRLLDEARSGAEYDVIVLQGGLNDWRVSAPDEYLAVQRAVRTARTQWPDAVVVVFGPTEPVAKGTGHAVHLATIRSAAEANGAVFIDPSSPLAWITDENSARLDSGDGLHLNDSGYAYLAGRFVTAVLEASAAVAPDATR